MAFDTLSNEEHKILESEFNALKPRAYQQALKGEVVQLKHEIESSLALRQ